MNHVVRDSVLQTQHPTPDSSTVQGALCLEVELPVIAAVLKFEDITLLVLGTSELGPYTLPGLKGSCGSTYHRQKCIRSFRIEFLQKPRCKIFNTNGDIVCQRAFRPVVRALNETPCSCFSACGVHGISRVRKKPFEPRRIQQICHRLPQFRKRGVELADAEAFPSSSELIEGVRCSYVRYYPSANVAAG
jgi:hypothetical protein